MKERYFLFSLLVYLLLPFCILSYYTYPGLEDYSQSMLSQTLGRFVHFKDLYFTYDGRYFVALLYAINPLVNYNFWMYKLIPLLHFVLLYSGLLYLMKVSFPKTNLNTLLLYSILLFAMSIYVFPSMPAAFYYMVSTMVYFTPMVLTVLLCILIILMYKSLVGGRKFIYLLLASIFILMILGCNEMYLILLPYTVFSLVIYFSFKKSDHKAESFILLFAVACGLYIHLSAPGIQSHFTQEPINFDLAYLSNKISITISQNIKINWTWLKNHYLLWALSVLYIPVGIKLVQNNPSLQQNKKSYLLFCVSALAIYLILPLPYYWALDHVEGDYPDRIFNVTHFLFPFLWFFILQNILNFSYPYLNISLNINNVNIISSFTFLGLLPFSPTWNSAVTDILSGDARNYHLEMQKRLELLKTHDKNDIVYIDTLRSKPKTIFSGFDLQNNRFGGWNEVYESYFKVQQIILEGDKEIKPRKKSKFNSKKISKEELQKRFLSDNIPLENIDSAINIGLFDPSDSLCNKQVLVYPPINFEWIDLNKDIEKGGVEGLIALTSSLYQIFADPRMPQKENYPYEKMSLDSILSNIISGVWAPQCGGISLITSRIINELGESNYFATAAHLDEIEHDICLVYFKEKTILYAVAIDVQNGIIGPIYKDSRKAVSIDELKQNINITDNVTLLHLNDSILRRKRNLYEEIPACNFFPLDIEDYHFAQKENEYKFEILSYSLHYYLWFKKNRLNEIDLISDINNKIILHESLNKAIINSN